MTHLALPNRWSSKWSSSVGVPLFLFNCPRWKLVSYKETPPWAPLPTTRPAIEQLLPLIGTRPQRVDSALIVSCYHHAVLMRPTSLAESQSTSAWRRPYPARLQVNRAGATRRQSSHGGANHAPSADSVDLPCTEGVVRRRCVGLSARASQSTLACTCAPARACARLSPPPPPAAAWHLAQSPPPPLLPPPLSIPPCPGPSSALSRAPGIGGRGHNEQR